MGRMQPIAYRPSLALCLFVWIKFYLAATHIVYGSFHTTVAALRSFKETIWSTKMFTSWTFTEVCWQIGENPQSYDKSLAQPTVVLTILWTHYGETEISGEVASLFLKKTFKFYFRERRKEKGGGRERERKREREGCEKKTWSVASCTQNQWPFRCMGWHSAT